MKLQSKTTLLKIVEFIVKGLVFIILAPFELIRLLGAFSEIIIEPMVKVTKTFSDKREMNYKRSLKTREPKEE